jgi:hypothetical protein
MKNKMRGRTINESNNRKSNERIKYWKQLEAADNSGAEL